MLASPPAQPPSHPATQSVKWTNVQTNSQSDRHRDRQPRLSASPPAHQPTRQPTGSKSIRVFFLGLNCARGYQFVQHRSHNLLDQSLLNTEGMTTHRLSMTPGDALQLEGPEARRLRMKNVLRQFYNPSTGRFCSLTAAQFTDVWNHFDQDGELGLDLGADKRWDGTEFGSICKRCPAANVYHFMLK
ncbi:unnamed protein product [Protopolystoma xenopodis]|uniref:EF-hand domain-containing protein n=1 Tax=Protopolystoma xenopodis TaxID=117903 RepID=A0A3S5FHD1_9PLAT|nr:unnamed protein product [Protopolystoma xenopodis]